jgi:hypothetical protein
MSRFRANGIRYVKSLVQNMVRRIYLLRLLTIRSNVPTHDNNYDGGNNIVPRKVKL